MDNSFRITITDWAKGWDIHTTICQGGSNRDVVVIALPDEILYLRDGDSLPNLVTFKMIGLIIITFHASQLVSLLKLKSPTWGRKPRELILIQGRVWYGGGSDAYRLASKKKERFCQCHPLKLVTSFKQELSSLRLRWPKMRLFSGPLSSHLSFQRDRWLSLPTTHLDPLLNTTYPFLIAD